MDVSTIFTALGLGWMGLKQKVTFSIFFSDNNLFKYMMHQLAKTIPLKTKFSFELNWDPWLGHFPLIHTPPRKISMPHVPTLSGLLIWMFAVMTSARQVSKCQVKMPQSPRSDTAQCSATQPSPRWLLTSAADDPSVSLHNRFSQSRGRHLHSAPMALGAVWLIPSTSANPANTGRAAVLYTAQLLCLCWLDWQT